MQHYDRNLEEAIAKGVARLRARFPGCYVEWDFDMHDRFVIAEIMFDPESTRAEWLAALSEILDVHRIKAVAPFPNARPEVIAAFEDAGYELDAEGNAVRAGLCLRDEANEAAMTSRVRELDRRFQDVYFEWGYTQEGTLALQHIESARTRPEARVEQYLQELRSHLLETGMAFQVEEQARTEWLDFRLEAAGFVGGDDGIYVPSDTCGAIL